MSDTRPENCRFRLSDEGKTYPRSACHACGWSAMSGICPQASTETPAGECFVIGRKVTIESNGHTYMAEPFIVFQTKAHAEKACDMIEKISGQRPLVTTAALHAGDSQ